MIWVNFKTYQEGTGQKALELAKICQEAEKESGVTIIPVVQATDIFRLAQAGFKVWAQHLDDIEYGANTGQILPEAVLAAGAQGTLLNHSENKLPVEIIGETLKRGRDLGLKFLVCAESVEEGKEIVRLRPDFLAYEPPELIGGNVSVSLAKPEIVRDFVLAVGQIPVLIGAGIHKQTDIIKGRKLGAKGFLISSGVVLAKNPGEKLKELASGFTNETI
jgi:triosephosphate isomerase